MSDKPALSVSLAIMLLSIAGSAPASKAAQEVTIRLVADDPGRRVAADLELDGIDYGSFLWLQVSEAEVAALTGRGAQLSVVGETTQVRLPGYRFDPLADGEPLLPASQLAKASGPRLLLLQLRGPLHHDWPQLLARNRLRILQYLPHNTYLVWSEGDTGVAGETTEAAAITRWQGEYHPAYKVSPTLVRLMGERGEPRPAHVRLYDDGRVEQARAAIEATGATITGTLPLRPDLPFAEITVLLDLETAQAVAQIPVVTWIGPHALPVSHGDELSATIVAGEHEPETIRPGYPSWLDRLGADGSGVTWSVVDSGVDHGHPDLELAGGYSHGCETPAPGDDGVDPIGHGTPVAGIVGGQANTGMSDENGFLYGLGVAPGARIFAQKDCFEARDGQPPAGGWEEFSRTAEQAGATGSNNSWGNNIPEAYSYLEVSQTYDTLVRDADFSTPEVAEEHLMIFCAGNNGPDPATIWTPAQAKNVISVGATRNLRESPYYGLEPPAAGDIDEVASYSSRGPTSDGRIAPTVVAPGDAVISTRHAEGTRGFDHEVPDTGGLYCFFYGCSAATPHVSGALAVITQWWRGLHNGDDPSPAMARALLVNGAVDIAGAGPIPNNDEGWGRIDLGNVVEPAAATEYLDQDRLLVSTGATWTAFVTVPDLSRPLKITLAWSDVPAALEADPVLVNDLDLEVTSNGSTYRGNLFADGWSVAGGSADSLHTLENVYLREPGATATITVTAARLAADGVPLNRYDIDQDFALVCSNCEGLHLRRGAAASVQVNVNDEGLDTPADAANEPTIAVDPTAPNRLVIAWRQFDSITSDHRTLAHASSNDGGRTWTSSQAADPGVFRTDPVLAADGDGRFYLYSVGSGFDHAELFTSDDGGVTWSAPLPALGGDKPWIAVDPETGMLYAVWRRVLSCCDEGVFSRSADRGVTFMTPIELDPTPEAATIAIGPDQEVYLGGVTDDNSFVVARSDNASDPEASPVFTFATVDLGGYFLTDQAPNPNGLSGQVWVATDTSGGPRRGAVYLLCSVAPLDAPGSLVVRFAASTDRGATWSGPVTVAPAGNGVYQWFGTLSVAPDGRLDVVWVESLDPQQPSLGELRYASSADGGATWSAAMAITPMFDSHLGWPQQQRLGDYYHMVSDATGVDLAYAATFGGEQNIYYLRLGERDCNRNGLGDDTELTGGLVADCDGNGIPDSCEIAAGIETDGLCADPPTPRRAGGRRR